MDFLRTLLQDVPRDRPSHVLDIGANEGGYTHLLLQHLPLATVYAFEPLPAMFEKLVDRYGAHPQVWCYSEGVSDRVHRVEGVAVHEAWTLDKPEHARRGRNATYGGPTFDVDFVTVDTLIGKAVPKVDFLKIDTDGYELRVLRGARETLLRDRPPVLIELGYLVQDLGDQIEEFVNTIHLYGYKLFAQDGRALPIETWPRWYPFHTTFDVAMLPAEIPLRPLD